jgi:hypothetical protein
MVSDINYLTTASSYDSSAGVSLGLSFGLSPLIYDNLVWVTTPILKSVLEDYAIAEARAAKVVELNDAMYKDVTAGFLSDILVADTFRLYASDLQGQILIVGASLYTLPSESAPATSFTITNTDPVTKVVYYDLFTHTQIRQLFTELVTFSDAMVSALASQIQETYTVTGATANETLALISAITWVRP